MGIRAFPNHPLYYSSHNVQAKKKAPKKNINEKKIFNGINKYNINYYIRCTNTHTQYYITITYVLDYCTNINYQEHITAAKMLRKKKISKADKLEEEKKSIPTVETLHLMSTDFIKFPHME